MLTVCNGGRCSCDTSGESEIGNDADVDDNTFIPRRTGVYSASVPLLVLDCLIIGVDVDVVLSGRVSPSFSMSCRCHLRA